MVPAFRIPRGRFRRNIGPSATVGVRDENGPGEGVPDSRTSHGPRRECRSVADGGGARALRDALANPEPADLGSGKRMAIRAGRNEGVREAVGRYPRNASAHR